ncbi:MAG: hypothetical protein JXO72_12965 [Vicinamibacteria bacterium]|nr:hypothetical protein [Vicinamibacteria bacterium]
MTKWTPRLASRRKRAWMGVALTLGYLGLTLLFTYPLASCLMTCHAGEAGGDAPTYVWNLWWMKKSLIELHSNPLTTEFIFHPIGISLALHTLGATQGAFFVPLSLALGDVAAANVVVLLTFLFSALAVYALARHYHADRGGAFLAGAAFAFCPYRVARLAGHYDLLSTEWIPLFLLCFAKALDRTRRSRAWLVMAALTAAACGYANLSYLVFLGLIAIVFVLERLARKRAPWRTLFLRAGFVFITAGILLSPLFIAIAQAMTRWTYPPYPGAERYSADLLSYLLPAPNQNVLGGALGYEASRNATESIVFPGYLPWLLGLAALLKKRLRRSHAFWIASGVIFFLFSLGPVLRVAGRETGLPLPFALLQRLPLLHNLRAPARFSLIVVLALAILMAAGWTALSRRLRRRSARYAMTGAAAAALILELVSVPVSVFAAETPALFRAVGAEPGDFAVVEIPGIDQVSGRLMHHQTAHGKRIFIGFCARVPLEKKSYYYGLPLVRPLIDLRKRKIPLDDALVERERTSAPRAARFLGIRYFVIERSFAKRGVIDYLERVLPIERLGGDDERELLRVREEELPPLPWTIEAGAPESRLYFESGWRRPAVFEGRLGRAARGRRSTVLLRRPAAGTSAVTLVAHVPASLPIDLRIDDERIGRLRLPAGWSRPRIELPASKGAFAERLTLLWNGPADPSIESAIVTEIRFVRSTASYH